MKNTLKTIITLLTGTILFVSCSKDPEIIIGEPKPEVFNVTAIFKGKTNCAYKFVAIDIKDEALKSSFNKPDSGCWVFYNSGRDDSYRYFGADPGRYEGDTFLMRCNVFQKENPCFMFDPVQPDLAEIVSVQMKVN